MKVFKLATGRARLAYLIYCFRPRRKDKNAKVGTVVVRIPFFSGRRAIIGKIASGVSSDLLMDMPYTIHVKKKILELIDALLRKGKSFTTHLQGKCLTFKWTCVSAD